MILFIWDARKKKRYTTSENCNSQKGTTSTTNLPKSTTSFETNFEIKYFNNLINKEKYPSWIGSIHTLSCPIKNKDLINELLCGLDPKYSTDTIILYSGFIYNTMVPAIYINCVDLVVHNMLENVDTKYLWHGNIS